MFRTTYSRSKRNGWRTRALPTTATLVGIGGAPASIPYAVAEPDTVILADLDVDIGGNRTPIPPPTGTVREFELVAAPTRWEILPGVEADALA